MGGWFSSSALDKKSLDVVQHQLLENGLDLGEIQECSLMDNERGGTFFLKFSTAEAVLRVWDRHCSWWAFEFAHQSEREVWALRLAEAAGVPVPSVMATGNMEQAGRQCPWALLRYIKDVRDDDWDDEQPVQRVASILIDPLVRLQRGGPLTEEVLRERGVLKAGQKLADCPIPCMPTHNEVIEYLRQSAARVDDPNTKTAVEKISGMFSNITPIPPCLVHSDLHPGNLLVDQSFQLRALIDWEEAAISDPRIDVAQACLACDDHDVVWQMYSEQTGLDLGPRLPWTALVAMMRYMVRVLIDWYEKTGKEVPEKNLSGWESLCCDAEEILIHLNVLPNPADDKSRA